MGGAQVVNAGNVRTRMRESGVEEAIAVANESKRAFDLIFAINTMVGVTIVAGYEFFPKFRPIVKEVLGMHRYVPVAAMGLLGIVVCRQTVAYLFEYGDYGDNGQ